MCVALQMKPPAQSLIFELEERLKSQKQEFESWRAAAERRIEYLEALLPPSKRPVMNVTTNFIVPDKHRCFTNPTTRPDNDQSKQAVPSPLTNDTKPEAVQTLLHVPR